MPSQTTVRAPADPAGHSPPKVSPCPDVPSCSAVGAERLRTIRQELPAEQVVQELAQVFALLSDPGRLRLTAALLHAGEMCVRDLAAVTGQSVSATSCALRLLRAHRVVQVRRAGRLAYYRLADSHMRILFAQAITHIGE